MGDMASRVRSLGGLVLRCHGSGCVDSEIKKRFRKEKYELLCSCKIYAIVSEMINFN